MNEVTVRDSQATLPTASRRSFLRNCAVAAAGVAAFGLAACTDAGSAPTGTSSPAAGAGQAPGAQTLTKLRIGVAAGVFENAYTQIGIEKGFYRDEGLDVEYVELADGGTILKAMLAGELTNGEMGVGALFTGIATGAAYKLVGMNRPKLNFVLYTKREITRPEDLVGKSIGTAATGSFLHQIATAYLKLAGVDESKVTFVNIGSSPAVFQAVLVGKVDAGPSSVDFLPTMQASGANIKALVNYWELMPEYLRTGIASSDKDIADRPNVVAGLLLAQARSTRYGIEHGDEIVKFAVERYGKKPEDVQFGHEFGVKNRIVDPDLGFTPEQVNYMQRLNIEAGTQQEVLPFNRLATLDFQRQVIEKLGTYTWK